MKDLAVLFRFLQLYTHIAHNLVAHSMFFQDHEFLGDLYSTYEGYYDSIVERMIGLGTTPNLFEIQTEAVNMLNQHANEDTNQNSQFFNVILGGELAMCNMIANINSQQTLGTQNLIQGMADESEVRQYKIKQRLK